MYVLEVNSANVVFVIIIGFTFSGLICEKKDEECKTAASIEKKAEATSKEKSSSAEDPLSSPVRNNGSFQLLLGICQ
jgi:hypothetical protein